MATHRATQVIAEVEALERLKTALVEHVRAVQKVHLAVLVVLVGVVADGALFFLPRCCLVPDGLPKLIQHLLSMIGARLLLLGPLSSLLPDARHVGQKAIEQFIRVLDALIDLLDGPEDLLPLFGHHCQVALAYPAKLIADEAFPQGPIGGGVSCVFHVLVEVIALQEPASQALHRHYAADQVALHALCIGFLIVIRLPADGASPLMTLASLESLERVKALLVEHMGTAEDGLLLEPQIIVAYGAGFFVIEALERLLLYVFPLLLAEWQGRLLDQAQALRQGKVLDVLHTLLFDLVVVGLVLFALVLEHLGHGVYLLHGLQSALLRSTKAST